jgi:hypothetical protein
LGGIGNKRLYTYKATLFCQSLLLACIGRICWLLIILPHHLNNVVQKSEAYGTRRDSEQNGRNLIINDFGDLPKESIQISQCLCKNREEKLSFFNSQNTPRFLCSLKMLFASFLFNLVNIN